MAHSTTNGFPTRDEHLAREYAQKGGKPQSQSTLTKHKESKGEAHLAMRRNMEKRYGGKSA